MDRQVPRLLLLLGTASLTLGFLASLAGGWFRRLNVILMLVAAAGMAVVLRRHPLPDDPLGGRGYERRPVSGARLVQVAMNILYIAGVMVVVFALLVRTGVLAVDIDIGLVQVFPLVTGIYAWFLGLAATMQLRRGASPAQPWILRAHDFLLWGVLAVCGLLMAVLLFVPEISVGGDTLLRASDMPVLALFGVLGIGTHLLLATGIPTAVDLVTQLFDRSQQAERSQTPPILYAAVLAVVAAIIVSFLASTFDLFDRLGRFQDDRVVYVIAIVPLAIVAFFVASAVGIWREGRRGLYKKRLPASLKLDITVYGISGALGLLGFIALTMALDGSLTGIPGFSTGRDLAKDLTAFTIVVSMGPIGWYLHRKHQRVDNIEMRLPDFLNDLAESRRAGLTLASALQAAAKTDYGMLTAEVRKMATQVGWGVAFTEALQQFADRVKTSLVRRTAQLIIESSRTGGSIAEVLKAAARDAYEIKSLESERRVTMATYLIVIYVVFFVFMVVLAALDTQFIPGVIEAQSQVKESGIEGGLGTGGDSLDQESIRFVYFNAAMVQALGNGLVAGVLTEGRVTAGFRHVAIMVILAWFAFRLLLGIL